MKTGGAMELGGDTRWCRAAGFTLIEVAIALAILALSLGVLLDVQAQCLADASRSRNLTIASLLARSKMVDIEQKLFDEGFTMGEDTDEGDFGEEGQKEFKWEYRVIEIELDLNSLSGLCGGFAESGDDEEGVASSCEGMFSGLSGPLQSLTDELGRSMRLVTLKVGWSEGKFSESMSFSAIVTREDFSMAPADLLGLP